MLDILKRYYVVVIVSTCLLVACSKATNQQTSSGECGSISIADMNWNSATLLAHIDRFILTQAFGCQAELTPGDTMPTSTSMAEKSQPDIAPEMWINTSKEILSKAVAENKLLQAVKVFKDGGQEGFWIPQYLLEQYPEMQTIEGVIKHAKLFVHPEEKDKSAFYGCPAGWGCQISSSQLFKALKLKDAGFDLIDPGSGAGLAGSIAKANERKQPWLGYYWAPTPVLGKYAMYMVKFGTGYVKEEFSRCTTNPECKNPKVTMYPSAPVYSYTTTKFKQQHPKAFAYISKRSIDNRELNKVLAWMESNQADGSTAVVHFMKYYRHVWHNWLEDDEKQKLDKIVSEL